MAAGVPSATEIAVARNATSRLVRSASITAVSCHAFAYQSHVNPCQTAICRESLNENATRIRIGR